MSEIQDLIKEVLDKGYLMSIGTVDNNGAWVSDVIYIHDDDLNIYWMSDPDVRHSQALRANAKIAGTITVSGQGEDNLGIQFEGEAQIVDGSRHDLAVKHFAKRNKPAPDASEDVLDGDSWYLVKPKKIDLICERLYGFDKQSLEL